MALRLSKLTIALAAFAGLSTLASASTIQGTLNGGGTITITPTSLSFSASGVPGNYQVTTPNTGSFADLAPSAIGQITDLTSANSTIGTPFAPVQWITLPNGVVLDATLIPLDLSVPAYTGNGATQVRPTADSPIVLSFTNGSTNATFAVQGTARISSEALGSGTSPFLAALSTQFTGQTIDQVIASFQGGGDSLSASYASTIVTIIPEPATIAFLGAGLLTTALVARRRRARS